MVIESNTTENVKVCLEHVEHPLLPFQGPLNLMIFIDHWCPTVGFFFIFSPLLLIIEQFEKHTA